MEQIIQIFYTRGHNSYKDKQMSFQFTFSRQGIPIICKYGVLYSEKCLQPRDKHRLFCADDDTPNPTQPNPSNNLLLTMPPPCLSTSFPDAKTNDQVVFSLNFYERIRHACF